MNIYEKYYLSDDIIQKILKEGIVVFDTSALLDLYYYSQSSQTIIFEKIFGYLSNRLWIPAQVYFEFLKNKDIVAEKPIISYENLIHEPKSKADGGHVDRIVTLSKELPKKLDPIKNQIKTLKEKTIHEDKYPNLPEETYNGVDDSIEKFEAHIKEFINNIETFEKDINEVVDSKIELLRKEKEEDRVLQEINKKFKVSKEYTYEQQLAISKEGAFRYSEQIPPGYEDAEEKIGMQKYGDLFVWKQILEIGSKEKKPIILITNDVKEDWHDEKADAPRFELLKEFQSVCKNQFWTYTMRQFVYDMNNIIETEQSHDQEAFDQMLKETEAIEVEKNASGPFYMNMINEFLAPEVFVGHEIPLTDEWKTFRYTHIFAGVSESGKGALVMVNRIKRSNYTSVLLPLRYMQEVKKYFDDENVPYEYYQFIVATTEESAMRIVRNHLGKSGAKDLYSDKDVNIFVGFRDEDIFRYITSNMDDEYSYDEFK